MLEMVELLTVNNVEIHLIKIWSCMYRLFVKSHYDACINDIFSIISAQKILP